jgi:hypothetical protein
MVASQDANVNTAEFERIGGSKSTTAFNVGNNHGAFTGTVVNLYAGEDTGDGFSILKAQSNNDATLYDLRGDGNAYCEASWNNGYSDYAEFFETTDGNAIAVGTTVTLEGDKIRACAEGETPIGVIRPFGQSTTTGGNPQRWHGKWQTDAHNTKLYEDYTVTQWEASEEDGGNAAYDSDRIPEGVVVPDDAEVLTHNADGKRFVRTINNPDYDESLEYISREDRDEWQVVGLLGQVPITKGQPVADNWIKMKDMSNTVELWFIK